MWHSARARNAADAARERLDATTTTRTSSRRTRPPCLDRENESSSPLQPAAQRRRLAPAHAAPSLTTNSAQTWRASPPPRTRRRRGLSHGSSPRRYLAADDCTDLDAAKAEVQKLRKLLVATIDAADSGVDAGDLTDAVGAENGHHVIKDLVETSTPAFAALAKDVGHAPGAAYKLGFIADQDQSSKADDGTFTTAFASATLTYVGPGDAPAYSFKLDEDVTCTIGADCGDKSGRGAEYSLLEWYGGKLVTACDRTGNLDEIAPNSGEGSKYVVKPVLGPDGSRVRLLLGDGKKDKGARPASFRRRGPRRDPRSGPPREPTLLEVRRSRDAAPPRPRAGDSKETRRGAAAAATWIFSKDLAATF